MSLIFAGTCIRYFNGRNDLSNSCINHSDRTKTFTLIASTASTPSPLNGPTRKVRKLLMDRTKNPNSTIDQRVEQN